MVRIKEIWADHPLLAIGVTLFILVNIAMGWLSKFYDNLEQVPGFITATLVVALLSSFILTAVGGVLYLGKQGGAKGFKQTSSVFFRGYWQAAKIPFLLALLFFIVVVIAALLTK